MVRHGLAAFAVQADGGPCRVEAAETWRAIGTAWTRFSRASAASFPALAETNDEPGCDGLLRHVCKRMAIRNLSKIGGVLFIVNGPEQRRLGIKESHVAAWQDWVGAAGFDRDDGHWPKRWAEASLAFVAGEKRSWLTPWATASSSPAPRPAGRFKVARRCRFPAFLRFGGSRGS